MGFIPEVAQNVGDFLHHDVFGAPRESDGQRRILEWRSQYGQPGLWTAEELHAVEAALMAGEDPWSVLPETYEQRQARRAGEATVSPQTTDPSTFYADREAAGNEAAGGALPAPTVGGLPAVIAGEQRGGGASRTTTPLFDPLMFDRLQQRSMRGLKGTFKTGAQGLLDILKPKKPTLGGR